MNEGNLVLLYFCLFLLVSSSYAENKLTLFPQGANSIKDLLVKRKENLLLERDIYHKLYSNNNIITFNLFDSKIIYFSKSMPQFNYTCENCKITNKISISQKCILEIKQVLKFIVKNFNIKSSKLIVLEDRLQDNTLKNKVISHSEMKLQPTPTRQLRIKSLENKIFTENILESKNRNVNLNNTQIEFEQNNELNKDLLISAFTGKVSHPRLRYEILVICVVIAFCFVILIMLKSIIIEVIHEFLFSNSRINSKDGYNLMLSSYFKNKLMDDLSLQNSIINTISFDSQLSTLDRYNQFLLNDYFRSFLKKNLKIKRLLKMEITYYFILMMLIAAFIIIYSVYLENAVKSSVEEVMLFGVGLFVSEINRLYKIVFMALFVFLFIGVLDSYQAFDYMSAANCKSSENAFLSENEYKGSLYPNL